MAALPGHRCVTPATLAVMYRYPFMELGCQMVAHTFPKSSAHLERQGAALGGMLINIPRMFGREMDGTVCLLTYEDWVASKRLPALQASHRRTKGRMMAYGAFSADRLA